MKKIVITILILGLSLYLRGGDLLSVGVIGAVILLGGNIAGLFMALSLWHISIVNNFELNSLLLINTLGIYLIQRHVSKLTQIVAAIFLFLVFTIYINPLEAINNGISNTQVPIWITDEQRREHDENFNNSLIIVLHNKVVNYTLSYIQHYSLFLEGNFLFLEEKLYLIESVFILFALYIIVKKPKKWNSILLWLFIAPLFPALYLQPPNSEKSVGMLVPLTLISAFGFTAIIRICVLQLMGMRRTFLKGLDLRR